MQKILREQSRSTFWYVESFGQSGRRQGDDRRLSRSVATSSRRSPSAASLRLPCRPIGMASKPAKSSGRGRTVVTPNDNRSSSWCIVYSLGLPVVVSLLIASVKGKRVDIGTFPCRVRQGKRQEVPTAMPRVRSSRVASTCRTRSPRSSAGAAFSGDQPLTLMSLICQVFRAVRTSSKSLNRVIADELRKNINRLFKRARQCQARRRRQPG